MNDVLISPHRRQ